MIVHNFQIKVRNLVLGWQLDALACVCGLWDNLVVLKKLAVVS